MDYETLIAEVLGGVKTLAEALYEIGSTRGTRLIDRKQFVLKLRRRAAISLLSPPNNSGPNKFLQELMRECDKWLVGHGKGASAHLRI